MPASSRDSYVDPWNDTSSASIDQLEMSQPFRTSVLYGEDELQRPASLVASAAPRPDPNAVPQRPWSETPAPPAPTPAPRTARERAQAAAKTDILPKRRSLPPEPRTLKRVGYAAAAAGALSLAAAALHLLGWF